MPRLGYARVSTDDQSPDLQLDALRHAGCTKVYTDHGISGVAIARPQLDRCLKALKSGDTLVVWKLDRLGRSLGHLIHTIDSLRARGVGFQSLTEAIDTGTAHGKLLLHLMGALAEFERSLLAERTAAGRAAARKRGVHMGRPKKIDAGPHAVDPGRHAIQLVEQRQVGGNADDFGKMLDSNAVASSAADSRTAYTSHVGVWK